MLDRLEVTVLAVPRNQHPRRNDHGTGGPGGSVGTVALSGYVIMAPQILLPTFTLRRSRGHERRQIAR